MYHVRLSSYCTHTRGQKQFRCLSTRCTRLSASTLMWMRGMRFHYLTISNEIWRKIHPTRAPVLSLKVSCAHTTHDRHVYSAKPFWRASLVQFREYDEAATHERQPRCAASRGRHVYLHHLHQRSGSKSGTAIVDGYPQSQQHWRRVRRLQPNATRTAP